MTGYWIVTVHYNPGTPKSYRVRGAHTPQEANDTVLRHIRYNPGVPLCALNVNGKAFRRNTDLELLLYVPLTNAERDMIRFND